MKHLLSAMILVLNVFFYGMAQDAATVQATASAVPEAAPTDDAEPNSPLAALDWMIGTWVDAGEDATIVTECSWTKNRKFLKRSFQVEIDEEVTLEGDQFVGWDPLAGQIRSWTIDKTQRAAWKAADGTNANIVMETGLYNLTQDQAEVLVHSGPEQTQTALLVRLDENEQPESEEGPEAN